MAGILDYDGTGWTHQPLNFSGSIFGMDGSGPADIWAVGPRTVLHYDGKIWQEVKAGANKGFNDVWVAGPNDAWFVGEAGIRSPRERTATRRTMGAWRSPAVLHFAVRPSAPEFALASDARPLVGVTGRLRARLTGLDGLSQRVNPVGPC